MRDGLLPAGGRLGVPGTDVLVGFCHCGATHESEDPVEMWEWLLAHPDGHS